jgi:cysteine-rich secretory family protein
MRSHLRRLVSVMFALVLVVGLAPAVGAADADISGAAVASAERRALDLTNRRRTDRGLVRLRLDDRLTELARQRAEYMARTGEFSHTQSGGTNVFDLIGASHIRWYAAAEIIAWNTAGPLDYSASFAVQGWMGSTGHRAIVLSDDYNYVGFGVAVAANGTRYWAGVYLRGPDRTAAWARVGAWRKVNLDRRYARVIVRWSGGDSRLQVLTSGLRYYQTQGRRDGGAWRDYGTTTATHLVRRWMRGHPYEFRVRSRDRAGNWSAWSTRTIAP